MSKEKHVNCTVPVYPDWWRDSTATMRTTCGEHVVQLLGDPEVPNRAVLFLNGQRAVGILGHVKAIWMHDADDRRVGCRR